VWFSIVIVGHLQMLVGVAGVRAHGFQPDRRRRMTAPSQFLTVEIAEVNGPYSFYPSLPLSTAIKSLCGVMTMYERTTILFIRGRRHRQLSRQHVESADDIAAASAVSLYYSSHMVGTVVVTSRRHATTASAFDNDN